MTQLARYFEPLIMASVGVASKLKDHQQQMTFLDQTKTLAESALQMLYAAKEGGGNPKVVCFMLFLGVCCPTMGNVVWAGFSNISPCHTGVSYP